jgi:pimeloyl-ACP methyl ester carboxylesterase
VTPTLFGDSASPLFGVVHEAGASSARDHGVVLCPPIAQEYVRAHWAMRQLALTLARAGFPCIRFDWYGVGDSSGDIRDACFSRWCGDAAAAAQELRDACGVRRLSLVGLRFGARIALSAASAIKPASLVLWDPVVDGRAYVEQLRTLHRALLVDPVRYWMPRSPAGERSGSPTELVGFDLGAELVRDLEAVPAEIPADLPRLRVGLVESDPGPAIPWLVEHLTKRGHEVERRRADLVARWNAPDRIEELLLPSDAVHRIVDLLEGRAATAPADENNDELEERA